MKLLKKYWQPTPKKWRKIGDALLAVSLFATPYPIVANNELLAIISLSLGIIGKFLTNFFSHDQSS